MNLKILCPSKGNVGDELNVPLFNRLFGSVFSLEKYRDIDFYGIGTVLASYVGRRNKCVIFGSGVRDITCRYNKENWNVFFLRGPISSNALGYNGTKYITDAAYSMLLVNGMIPFCTKQYHTSIIPHWSQMDGVNWEEIALHTGFHVISPRSGVSKVIKEITQSEKIIASAMHGAILADICRVPWLRLRMETFAKEPVYLVDMKWADWVHSMKLSEKFAAINTSYSQYKRELYTWKIINELKCIHKQDHLYQLSSDIILGNKVNCIANEAEKFLNCYR